jgi:hypothetical protein
MKIKSVERDEADFHVYVVTFEPNWFEKLFHATETQRKYKDTLSEYTFGGGSVYIDQTGERLSNGNDIAIDNWRRKW